MEITSPVVEIEEMKFEMVLLLLAFSPACIYIGSFWGSADSFIPLTRLKQVGP